MNTPKTRIKLLLFLITITFFIVVYFVLKIDVFNMFTTTDNDIDITITEPVEDIEEDTNLAELEDFNIREYLNIIPNTLYIFTDGHGNDFEYYFVEIDGDRVELLRKFPENAYLESLIISNDKITIESVSLLENINRNIFYSEIPIDTYAPIDIFTSPVVKNREWLSNGYVFKFLETEIEKIVVSGITYDGVRNEIHYTLENGLDKIVRHELDGDVTFSLVSIERDFKFNFNINTYYIDENMMETVPVNVKSSIYTNYTENDMFSDLFTKSSVEGLAPLLPENTVVNSIYKAKDLDYVSVDFSENFNELNQLGSSFESMRIYSVVNTLCDFYEVDKIKLTVEGESYQSGHFYFEDNIIERLPN